MTRILQTAAHCEAPPARAPERRAELGRLGSWQLVRLVAEGALARLYQARPAESRDRPALYALKLLRERWHESPEAVACLRREAMLGRSVSHAHLVSVLAAHVNEPPYYLVMPWLQGATLAARLAGGWRPALSAALWISRQIAEALAALHADGWMHADVKSSNVLVSGDLHATLLDLGFARRVEETANLADRPVVGTAHYVAPEMITSVWGADIRSDIYSLGVLLYELLAGRLPFPGGDLSTIVRAHRDAWPQPLRHLAPHVPHDVAWLVHEMLAKDPLRRPQTPRELAERLIRLEIATLAER
jgi:serine/threonine protein kinase